MPAALLDNATSRSVPPTEDGRKRWTRDDCQSLEYLGLLKGRYELLDGEIIVKSYQPDFGHLPPTPTGRKRWTRDDCDLLENTSLLTERYELIEGEIFLKVGQRDRHALVVMRFIAYCLPLFGSERVRTQSTVEVRREDTLTSRPEPDVFILRDEVRAAYAQGTDVLLAVEVCDSTYEVDFLRKAGLYARAGVQEYWILNLSNRTIVVFRYPEEGEWLGRDEYAFDGEVAPLCAPTTPVRIADLLP